ncbi:MAG: diguanylate cyclase [Rhodospirillaceae bacterium]
MTAPGKGHILICDDEPTNIEILVGIFEDDYEIIIALDGEQALDLARSERPDLVLLDVMMPGLDGYQVCARLKSEPETADIPVIFITGLGDERAETQGFDAGAIDYVTKPINPVIVRRRVSTHVELKKSRDRLAEMAVTDRLTGLANRRCFDQVLDLETRRLRRSGGLLSLVLLDVDHFKTYNDTYGHVAGDSCLQTVSATIRGAVNRATDLAARYGGEEFACILPSTPLAGAIDLAERIRLSVAGQTIPHRASATAPFVTVSLGVATIATPGADDREIAALVAAADTMLYRAKQTGRNRVVAPDPDLQPLSPAPVIGAGFARTSQGAGRPLPYRL